MGHKLFINEYRNCNRGIALYICKEIDAEEVKIYYAFKKLKLCGRDTLLIGCIYKSSIVRVTMWMD